jgi:hypothetical protein
VAEQTDHERAEALEAEAILKDARIAELVAEVDGLHKAMEHRAAIDQARGPAALDRSATPSLTIRRSGVRSGKRYEVPWGSSSRVHW